MFYCTILFFLYFLFFVNAKNNLSMKEKHTPALEIVKVKLQVCSYRYAFNQSDLLNKLKQQLSKDFVQSRPILKTSTDREILTARTNIFLCCVYIKNNVCINQLFMELLTVICMW